MAGEQPRAPAAPRSRTVCFRCHNKKVRCDLQPSGSTTAGARHAPCSACAAAGTTCEIRPSHKGRFGKRQVDGRAGNNVHRSPHRQRPARRNSVAACLGETSLLELFTRDDEPSGDEGGLSPASFPETTDSRRLDNISGALQQSNVEAYLEFCYPWCPVLDPDPALALARANSSLLLRHALALLGSSLRPSLLPHAAPREHYDRACQLFYNSKTRASPLERITACMLFHWWSAGPLTVVSLDGSFWWTGVAIRLAQGLGLHREPHGNVIEKANQRRLIWWTLYARERITAICQGRPCIIDEDYCDVRWPQVTDFQPGKLHAAHLFVNWVQLSSILGDVNKHLFLSQRSGAEFPTVDISNQLIDWIQSLPSTIQLPIASGQSIPFDRDVHLLHLPYLAMVTLVYFRRSNLALPEASLAAVIAAACTSRIFEDFLQRGSLSFLWGEAGWFIAIAILALVHVLPLPTVMPHAAQHIKLLQKALNHMATTRHSAKLFSDGIERVLSTRGLASRVRNNNESFHQHVPATYATETSNRTPDIGDLWAGDTIPWANFFPFVTADTSPLIAVILKECRRTSPEPHVSSDLGGQFDDFWEDLVSITDGLWSPIPNWL